MRRFILPFFIYVISLFSCFSVKAQGWIPNEKAYSLTPLATVYGGGAKADNVLRVVNKMKGFAPTPSNQGEKPSCVAEAICNALTIKKALDLNQRKKEDIDALRFSPAYLYHQLETKDCTQGTFFEQVMAIVQEQGVCALNQFNPTQCNIRPDENHRQLAAKNKISGFQRLFFTNSTSEDKLYAVKAALSSNLPVVAGFHLDQSFGKIPIGATEWNPASLDFSDNSKHSRHAMVIVGYDDDRAEFEVMNSWGTGWGNKGFIWIPYSLFDKVCECAYILEEIKTNISPKTNEKPLVSLGGKLGLRTPGGFDRVKNKRIVNNESVIHKGEGVFIPKNENWKVNTSFFQFAIKNDTSCSIYVISKNPNGKVNLNFPMKDERLLGTKFGDVVYDSENIPLMIATQPVSHCELILPDSTSAMHIIEAGEDQTCLLISTKRIEKIGDLVDKLNEQTGTMQERIKKHFGDALIPASEIKYEDGEEIKFTANSKSGGYIVPIFLNITAK